MYQLKKYQGEKTMNKDKGFTKEEVEQIGKMFHNRIMKQSTGYEYPDEVEDLDRQVESDF